MIGVILTAISNIFGEIRTSIGKYEIEHSKESLYAMGFLNSIWVFVFLLILGYFREGGFIFSLESLPTFLIKAVLEVVIILISINAIVKADRSTFSFIRTLTIPLLLVVDIILGYNITLTQIIGVSMVVIALLFLFTNHGLSKEGKLLTLSGSILSVITLSLYKYNITHYNSVEAEQTLTFLIIIVTLVVIAWIHKKENLFKYLTHKTFMMQSIASGLSGSFISFAFLFAPASIITTSNRSFEIITSMISGRAVFHEKHIVIKIIALALIITGIILVVI